MSLLHQPPTMDYCGLTIVLGKPSRFDNQTGRFFSGYAGEIFDTYLRPFVRQQCDIRTSAMFDQWPLMEKTRAVLLLGEESTKLYPGNNDKKYILSLNDLRGNPKLDRNIAYISTYAPQDACDRKDYEGENDEDNDTENVEDDSDVKSHSVTKRRNWKWWMFNDIKKAKEIVKGKLDIEYEIVNYNRFDVHAYPDINNVCDVLTTTKGESLYLDIETSKRQVMTCCGLNFSGSNIVYVVPWKRFNGLLAYEPQLARKFIQALCVAIWNNTVVCHNAYFDLLVLCWRYRIPVPRNIFDTMIFWHRCYPEIEKSLGHLISYFLNLEFHKDEGIYDPKNLRQEQQLWEYNAKDIITMRLIHKLLISEAQKLGAMESGLRACRYIRPYLTATLRGLRVDREKFIKKFGDLDLKREQIGRCLGLITGRPDFNPRSPKQVSNYLYSVNEGLGLHCPNLEEPTNSKTLLKICLKNPIPSIKLISTVKKTGKLASSLKYRLWPDLITNEYDRATTGYNIGATDSFRLGSRAIFKYKRGATKEERIGYGTNLQNQKKEMRDLIIADKGKKLGQCDQAGAEALIVAYLCRPGRFRNLFLFNIKPHIFVGLHVFKEQWMKRYPSAYAIDELCKLEIKLLSLHPHWEKVKKLIASSDEWGAKERFYFIAKMICHASNYGMKAPTFQTNVMEKSEGAIILSKDECGRFLTLYHQLFPEIREWHLETQMELKNTRVLRNLFGEPRQFNGPFDDELWKAGYAFRPQSTVGQITNIAFSNLQHGIDNGEIDKGRLMGLEILQNNHDSILFQFNDGNLEIENEACRTVSWHLNMELISPRNEPLKMKSECATGYNWRPYKKGINELGLKEFKITNN